MSLFLFAQAAAPAATPPQSLGGMFLSMLPMFVVIIVIFYFIVYRPQQKEQKRRNEVLNNLNKGDKVITAGGIHGVVATVKTDTVLIKVDGDVKLEVSKPSVTVVQAKG
ncbi:MAG: preprotein translocase subunit YajC [Candidatus Auribacterota bacterium]|jgi:preprotein translocase subunit YajC|uniref:Sec translocon accessory complex subunit YajC n=1 Tax=Candidatus Auribacter fodinae TaxID=2093366 RepID=A0A3A4R4T6_9BACT|nr:MAG: preprotein translocase subunit YajC [Candidatus Auribacter fodinae]